MGFFEFQSHGQMTNLLVLSGVELNVDHAGTEIILVFCTVVEIFILKKLFSPQLFNPLFDSDNTYAIRFSVVETIWPPIFKSIY